MAKRDLKVIACTWGLSLLVSAGGAYSWHLSQRAPVPQPPQLLAEPAPLFAPPPAELQMPFDESGAHDGGQAVRAALLERELVHVLIRPGRLAWPLEDGAMLLEFFTTMREGSDAALHDPSPIIRAYAALELLRTGELASAMLSRLLQDDAELQLRASPSQAQYTSVGRLLAAALCALGPELNAAYRGLKTTLPARHQPEAIDQHLINSCPVFAGLAPRQDWPAMVAANWRQWRTWLTERREAWQHLPLKVAAILKFRDERR